MNFSTIVPCPIVINIFGLSQQQMYNNNKLYYRVCVCVFVRICDGSVFTKSSFPLPFTACVPYGNMMCSFFHLAFGLFIYCRYYVSTFKLYVSSPCLCLYAHCKENTPKTKSIILFIPISCISVIHTRYRRVTTGNVILPSPLTVVLPGTTTVIAYRLRCHHAVCPSTVCVDGSNAQ